jgi:hypothetical protein
MKNQSNVSRPNSIHNNSTSESKDNELFKILKGEFRRLLLQMIRDLKENSNKQINDIKKAIQDIEILKIINLK